jgi:soluble lytic murein transglycosylase-like protein
MPQIGQFTRQDTGFAGQLATFTIFRDVVIVPAEPSDAENAPDYRVHASDDGKAEAGPEIGAGWKRTGERAGEYVAVLIDDPRCRSRSAPICSATMTPGMPGRCTGRARATAPEGLTDVRSPSTMSHRDARGRHHAVRRMAFLLLSGLALATGATDAAPAQSASAARTVAGDPHAAFVTEASQRFGIPEHWIVAVKRAESAGDVRAISSAGALGLMQVMPDTWAALRVRYGLGRDPYDPRDNILAGAAYLREMFDRYARSPQCWGPTMPGPAATTNTSRPAAPCPPKRGPMRCWLRSWARHRRRARHRLRCHRRRIGGKRRSSSCVPPTLVRQYRHRKARGRTIAAPPSRRAPRYRRRLERRYRGRSL